MEQTEKVIHNGDEDNENSEKKAKQLEEDKMNSTPPPTGKSAFYCKGCCVHPSKFPHPVICDGLTMLNVKCPDSEVHAYAVKGYNSLASKEKLELVKVKRATSSAVAWSLFDLIFDAKVLADGEEERDRTYQAEVWHKIGGTLEVITF